MEGEGTNGPSRTSRGYPSLMPSASATVLIEMRQMASSSRAGDGAGDDPFPTRFDRSMDDADIGIDSIDDDVPALELSDNYERENEQYENEQHEYERTPVARLDAAPFKSWPGWQASAMLTKQMCRMLSRAHHDHSSPSPWWWPFGRGPAGGSSSLSVSASSLSPSPSGPSSYSSAFSSSSSSSSSASKSGVLRFRNTSGEGPMRGALLHILRNRAAFPMPSPEELRAAYPVAAPDMCALAAPCAGALRVTWIGHATFVVQIDGLTVLTDPVWSDFISPLPWSPLGIPRYTPAPFALADLPAVDVVLLSHSHYDHCDIWTLRQLAARASPPSLWVAGLGLGAWLSDMLPAAAANVVELDWWESVELRRGDREYHICALPCQHWSNRGLLDRNVTLWAGFAVVTPKFRMAFVGDSAYCGHFRDWARCFDGFDLALLPIGAYEPRESHKVVHMNPEDAARAHLDLNARVSLGHHFGTFGGPYMGYRPILEPPVHLQQACRMHRVPRGSFVAPVHGETIVLHGGGDSGGDDTAEQAAISGPDASAASETDM